MDPIAVDSKGTSCPVEATGKIHETFVSWESSAGGNGKYIAALKESARHHVGGTSSTGQYVTPHSVEHGRIIEGHRPNVHFTSEAELIEVLGLVSSGLKTSDGFTIYDRKGFTGSYRIQHEADGTLSVFYSGGRHSSNPALVLAPQTFTAGQWSTSRAAPASRFEQYAVLDVPATTTAIRAPLYRPPPPKLTIGKDDDEKVASTAKAEPRPSTVVTQPGSGTTPIGVSSLSGTSPLTTTSDSNLPGVARPSLVKSTSTNEVESNATPVSLPPSAARAPSSIPPEKIKSGVVLEPKPLEALAGDTKYAADKGQETQIAVYRPSANSEKGELTFPDFSTPAPTPRPPEPVLPPAPKGPTPLNDQERTRYLELLMALYQGQLRLNEVKQMADSYRASDEYQDARKAAEEARDKADEQKKIQEGREWWDINKFFGAYTEEHLERASLKASETFNKRIATYTELSRECEPYRKDVAQLKASLEEFESKLPGRDFETVKKEFEKMKK